MATRPQQAGNKLDVLLDPIITGGDKPSLIDDRMQLIRANVANTILESHYGTGEFKVPYGRQDQRPGSPKDGDFFFNFSSGKLEMYCANLVKYTGTDAIIASGRTVTSALSTFFTRIHCGADVDFYIDADGAGAATKLASVDSDTQFKLQQNYSVNGGTYSALGRAFTIRLELGSRWVEVDKLLEEAFELEHHIRRSDALAQLGYGQHNIPRTPPTYPLDGQIWIDNGALKFQDAGVVSQLAYVGSVPLAVLSSGYDVTNSVTVPIVKKSGTMDLNFGTTEAVDQKTLKVYLPGGLGTVRWQVDVYNVASFAQTFEGRLTVDGVLKLTPQTAISATSRAVIDGGNFTITAGSARWVDLKVQMRYAGGSTNYDFRLFGLSVWLEK